MSMTDIIEDWRIYRDGIRFGSRGQTPFTLFFLLIVFIILWALFLARFFADSGDRAIQNGAVGVEAFLWSNLNFWIFICVVILIFAFAYISQR